MSVFARSIVDTMNWFQNSMSDKISFISWLSDPEYYVDLVCKFKKIIVRTDFFLISLEK